MPVGTRLRSEPVLRASRLFTNRLPVATARDFPVVRIVIAILGLTIGLDGAVLREEILKALGRLGIKPNASGIEPGTAAVIPHAHRGWWSYLSWRHAPRRR